MKDFLYSYGNIKMGRGNFDLPPVLIGTIFYEGERFLQGKESRKFNQTKTKNRIDKHKELAKKYKIPEMIEISATEPKAMKTYLEFYLDHYQPPIVLGGTFDARIAGIEYLKERGVKPSEYIYNTISNLKNQKELDIIEKNKLDTVVILIIGSENMTSSQRFNYITKKSPPFNQSILNSLRKLGVSKFWIDGGVSSLVSLAHILETQRLISESLKLPVGTAPNLFLFKYSTPRLNKKFHTRYRRASIMFIASWYSNFLFYGAIEDAKECFSSAYQCFEFKKTIRDNNIKLFD